jgi:hypothetical protein
MPTAYLPLYTTVSAYIYPYLYYYTHCTTTASSPHAAKVRIHAFFEIQEFYAIHAIHAIHAQVNKWCLTESDKRGE